MVLTVIPAATWLTSTIEVQVLSPMKQFWSGILPQRFPSLRGFFGNYAEYDDVAENDGYVEIASSVESELLL